MVAKDPSSKERYYTIEEMKKGVITKELTRAPVIPSPTTIIPTSSIPTAIPMIQAIGLSLQAMFNLQD